MLVTVVVGIVVVGGFGVVEVACVVVAGGVAVVDRVVVGGGGAAVLVVAVAVAGGALVLVGAAVAVGALVVVLTGLRWGFLWGRGLWGRALLVARDVVLVEEVVVVDVDAPVDAAEVACEALPPHAATARAAPRIVTSAAFIGPAPSCGSSPAA